MKAKEAIEFCGGEIKAEVVYCGGILSGINVSKRDTDLSEIIFLLQQGEKYKKMWEELMKIWFDYKADCYWLGDKAFPSVLPIIEHLNQKYFPKE